MIGKIATLVFVAAFGFSVIAAGPVRAEEVSPETVQGAVTVDAAKAKELFDAGAVFVDSRKDSDWDAGRIPGAVHLELKSAFNEAALTEAAGGKKDADLVMYCNGHSCMRSSEASEMAVKWGFTKVHYFRDGFPAWKDAGYPTE